MVGFFEVYMLMERLFFLALYTHVGRGIYFGSYSFKSTWLIGFCLLVLVMASAFLGYVLPWGQISFWGATVITNLFSAIPYFGSTLVNWLWGGFSVDNPTLTRFYSFHFLLPLLLSGVTVLHIFYLHVTGSNNPLGISRRSDIVSFHGLFSYKDLFGFVVFLWSLFAIIFFFPLAFIEAENFIPANPLVTPVHIVPEWYFLFVYAILRSVPSKLGGVLAMSSALFVLCLLPFSHSQLIKGLSFYGPLKGFFWAFVTCFVLLCVCGSWPVEVPYITVSRCLSLWYFAFYFRIGQLRHFWDRALS